MLTKDTLTTTLLVILIWGFAGALFGGLFAGLYQVLHLLGFQDWQPLVIAAAAAAMTTAAFYSAMPVALMGAMSGVLASIGYLIVIGHAVELPNITLLAAGVGTAGGAFYAWIGRGSSRPLAETLTGLLAGLLAGAALALGLAWWGRPVGMLVLAAGVVALVGSLFQLSERWLVSRSSLYLPGVLAAPLVSALIAAVIGAGIWIISGTTTVALDAGKEAALDQILGDVPPGLLGGLVGGALTGLLLELLGFRLEDQRAPDSHDRPR